MSIISSALSALKGIGNKVISGFSNPVSKSSNTASAFNAIQSSATPNALSSATGGKTSLNSQVQAIANKTQNAYTPTLANQVQTIASGVTPAYTSVNSYGGQTPISRSSGVSGSWSAPSGVATTGPVGTAPFVQTPVTISSGKTTGSSGVLAPISSATLSGGSPTISMPSAPGYSDVGAINTAGLDLGMVDNYTKDANGQYIKVQKTPEQLAEEERKKNYEDISSMITQKESVLASPEVQAAEAEKRAKQQEVNNYTAQLNSIVAKQNQDLLTLRGIGATEGVTETVYGGQQATINREAAIKALPVQAQIAAAQGNLQLAQDYLAQVKAVKQEQADADYNYNMAKFNALSSYLKGEEKIKLDKIVTNETRAYNQTQSNIELADKWAVYAKDNGKTNLITQITDLKPYDPQFREKLGAITAQIPSLDAQKKIKDMQGTTVSLVGLTPEQQADPFVKLLASTAGGKPITDTFAQSLNKGLNVLGQIGGLQTNIKDTNTGPLVGLFRGANPWDTNAQTIKAQLNAIVPNLARGVYGEVGVLTDNDIKTYSQTLPNLKSTDDVRNAVLGITVDLIGKSIKRTLEINAANGKDVSGFIDIYTEMNNTKNSIFNQISGYKDNKEEVNPFTQALNITTPILDLSTGMFNIPE